MRIFGINIYTDRQLAKKIAEVIWEIFGDDDEQGQKTQKRQKNSEDSRKHIEAKGQKRPRKTRVDQGR